MNLYLISQEENENYDTYDSAVVVAPDEETARNMNPSNGLPRDWDNVPTYTSWAYTVDQVSVEYLGVAAPGSEVGVVCASFNAG